MLPGLSSAGKQGLMCGSASNLRRNVSPVIRVALRVRKANSRLPQAQHYSRGYVPERPEINPTPTPKSRNHKFCSLNQNIEASETVRFCRI